MSEKEQKIGLDLYRIDTDYVKYLKKIENRVQHNYENKNNQKPYIGVVLEVNGKNFYAPLTSPKEKHKILKNTDPTTFKIISKGKFIGSILLNNMIPVNKDCITKIDIKSERNPVYRELLSRDYKVISAHSDTIKRKAETLYKAVIKNENQYFSKISFNFRELEIACDNYRNRIYDIKFSYDKEKSSYNLTINGKNSKEYIKNDSKILDILKKHPDVKKHNIPISELKEGIITKTDSMKGGNRPQDMQLNAVGEEVKQQKVKDQGIER